MATSSDSVEIEPKGKPKGKPTSKAVLSRVGTVLGSYRLVKVLGEGGMGVVYEGQHVRLGRPVAIKIMRPELANRAATVARFFREAQAVNEIGHQNIIDVLDFVDEREESIPTVYMVMELLDGESLGARVRTKGPLDPKFAVEVSVQVGRALIAVHRVKILHRDLKPENIFLSTREEELHVKLLDFGIAKAFGDRQTLQMTDPGTTVGTPEYMSPEQVLGKKLDQRTDIYGLGLVMYYMLTGAPPFMAERFGELLVAQVKQQPPPIGERRSMGEPVAAELEAIVMRCLEKDPNARYQNTPELLHALGSVFDGGIVVESSQAVDVDWTEPMVPTDVLYDEDHQQAEAQEHEELPKRRLPFVVAGLGVLILAAALLLILGGRRTPVAKPPKKTSASILATKQLAPPPPKAKKIAPTAAKPAAADAMAAKADPPPPPKAKKIRTPRRSIAKRLPKRTKTKAAGQKSAGTKAADPVKPPSKKRDTSNVAHGTIDPFAK